MILLLFVFWLMLNGRWAGDVLITGAVASVLVFFFAVSFCGWSPRKEKMAFKLLPGAVAYACALLWEIAKANFVVLRTIGKNNTSPCIRTIQTKLKTRMARVLFANSITLTPGTVTIQIVDNRITVHCLTKQLADDLTDMSLEKRLLEMEAKVFGKRV